MPGGRSRASGLTDLSYNGIGRGLSQLPYLKVIGSVNPLELPSEGASSAKANTKVHVVLKVPLLPPLPLAANRTKRLSLSITGANVKSRYRSRGSVRLTSHHELNSVDRIQRIQKQ